MASEFLKLTYPKRLVTASYPLLGHLVWAFRDRGLLVEQYSVAVLGLSGAITAERTGCVRLSGDPALIAEAKAWFRAHKVRVTPAMVRPIGGPDPRDVLELHADVISAFCAWLAMPELGRAVWTYLTMADADEQPIVAEMEDFIERLDWIGVRDRLFLQP